MATVGRKLQLIDVFHLGHQVVASHQVLALSIEPRHEDKSSGDNGNRNRRLREPIRWDVHWDNFLECKLCPAACGRAIRLLRGAFIGPRMPASKQTEWSVGHPTERSERSRAAGFRTEAGRPPAGSGTRQIVPANHPEFQAMFSFLE